MAALYDLGSQRPTYDFCTWLQRAWQEGHRDVAIKPGPNGGFQPQPHPPAEPWERRMFLDNVMLPAIPRFGMKLVEAGEWTGDAYHRRTIENYNKGFGLKVPEPSEKARRLVSAWCPKPYATVTLRQSAKNPARNSNLNAWNRFMTHSDIPVRIVPDIDHADTHCGWAAVNLDLRLALYEGAEMNYGVNNGPMTLLTFMTAPYRIYKQIVPSVGACTARWWREKVGLEPGSQFPWATENQRLMWRDDDYASLCG